MVHRSIAISVTPDMPVGMETLNAEKRSGSFLVGSVPVGVPAAVGGAVCWAARRRSRLLGRQRQDQCERGDDGHGVTRAAEVAETSLPPYDLTQVVTIENSYRRYRGGCGQPRT